MELAKPDVVDRRRRGGPHAARRLRTQLIKLFELAINLEWATTNPAALSEKVKRRFAVIMRLSYVGRQPDRTTSV
jgi:hypothetical protein